MNEEMQRAVAASKIQELEALKEWANELFNYCDMADSMTFNREDGVNYGDGVGFNFRLLSFMFTF